MSDLIRLRDQFDEIAAARGKEKETVIAKYKDDRFFVDTLEFVFSPYFTTGLAKKKMKKNVGALANHNLADKDLYYMFNYLKHNNSGSDNIIHFVQSWVLSKPALLHEFLFNIFTKDLQIGASIKTINKALGYELVKEHNLQAAKRWKDEGHKLKGTFGITLKMDGYRNTSFCYTDGKIENLSKSGLPWEDLDELMPQIEKLPKGLVYDGELVYFDDTLPSTERFNKTGSVLRTKGPKKGIIFQIFDIIPLDEFEKGKSKLGWLDRRKQLGEVISSLDDEARKFIKPVTILYIGDDKEFVMELMADVRSKGCEGLVINTLDGKYLTKRHSDILKLKDFYTVDLRITGYKEHKHGNKLGAFIVDYKGNELSVGYGYKDYERIEFWNNRDDMIGKIIEVELMEEIKSKDGKISARHGGFKQVRWDKNDVSYH